MSKLKFIPIGCCLLAATVTPTEAATTPNSIVTPQTPNRGIAQFLQGTDSTGTYKIVYTAGTNGSRCIGMVMNNNDAITSHIVTIQIVNGTTKYGGTVLNTVPGAGFANPIPPQSLTSPTVWPGLPVDQYGNPYIQLISGDTIQADFVTALSTTGLINIQVTCNDF